MKALQLISLSMLLTVVQTIFAGDAQAVERVEFCKLSSELTDDAGAKAYLKDKQLVYIEGLLGSTKTSFVENAAMLRELDPSVPVTKLAPPPKESVESNVGFLMSEIRKVSAKYPGRKIILLGMSKGGAEVTQLAGEHPELFETGVLAAVVPINSGVGGTILTDLELGDPATKARWEAYKKANHLEDGFVMRKIKAALKYLLLDTTSPGFRSMGTAESLARSKKLVGRLSSGDRELLSRKLFFVTSFRDGTDPSDSPWYTTTLGGFLQSEGAANDGFLFERNQRINGLGQHLMSVAKASHFNLTGNYGKGECRKEFTRFLIQKLAERP